jgi:hypothetical protein
MLGYEIPFNQVSIAYFRSVAAETMREMKEAKNATSTVFGAVKRG